MSRADEKIEKASFLSGIWSGSTASAEHTHTHAKMYTHSDTVLQYDYRLYNAEG